MPTGVTTPVVETMFATLVLPLSQVPPDVLFARVVVPLAHMVVVPVIIDGSGLTVIMAVVKHPPGRV